MLIQFLQTSARSKIATGRSLLFAFHNHVLTLLPFSSLLLWDAAVCLASAWSPRFPPFFTIPHASIVGRFSDLEMIPGFVSHFNSTI